MLHASETPYVMITALALLWAVGHARAATPINACGTVIKAPGSYVVTNNLSVKKGGGDCLTVSTSFVTIDLTGFTTNCGGQPVYGITDGAFTGIIVRNGIITGCASEIQLNEGVLIDGVSSLSNDEGSYVDTGSTVIRSMSVANRDNGIQLRCPGNAIDNTALGNRSSNLILIYGTCDSLNNLAP